jgi:hypothetical protein
MSDMKIDKEVFRRKCAVRRLLDLPLGEGRLDVKHPSTELSSVRPVLVVTDNIASAEARAHAGDRFRDGAPYAFFKPVTAADGSAASSAVRAEEILDAARRLSHVNAGKTVEVAAEGAAIEPAAWMFFLERPYFSTFTALGDCPVSEGFPSWKELVK